MYARMIAYRLFSFAILTVAVINIHAQKKTVATTSSLESDFKNPPVSARPKALWPWVNGNINLSQLTFEMEDAKRKGMGGFDIWDVGVSVDPNKVVPAGPPFLGNESVHAIAHTIREADRLGLEIGLTFSSSWNAGGSWVKPEHGAMGLFRRDTIVKGPMNFSAAIPFPEIPSTYNNSKTLVQLNSVTGLPVYYKEVATLAHPIQTDSTIRSLNDVIALDHYIVHNGQLTWKVPEGNWRITRYVCAPTGQPLAIPSTNSQGLMLDHFSAEAQRANMGYVFSRLLPATGSLKNRSLKYLYADSYEVNSAVWTPLMPEAFKKRNGYSLVNYLPILDGFRTADVDTTNRFLFDFRKTLSDLIIENHYELGRKLCEEQGIGFAAEAGGPGQPIHNVPFEDLKALGTLTIPRGEFWNKHPQLELLQIIKGISSAAHFYNQKYVEAESFTSVWLWQEGPDELKPLADRAMCEGLNRFVYHTFPHTPPESGYPGWVYNFGTLINTTNGWWPKSKGFHEYLARCSYLLQQGNFVGDVAYYYGDEAPNFVPPKKIDPSLGLGYDYDVVNTEVLLEKMQVRNGKIYLPHGQSYEVLVLPQHESMNPKVAQKLQEMVAAGAIVIGPKPARSYGLNNAEENDTIVRTVANTLWGTNEAAGEKKYGKGKVIWNKTIRAVLSEKDVQPDLFFRSSNKTDSIDFIHRTTGKEHIYFIRNMGGDDISGFITLRVKGMQPELWNPETGATSPIHSYRNVHHGIEIPLSFTKYGSSFIVFRKSLTPGKGIVLSEETMTGDLNVIHADEGLLVSKTAKVSGTKNGKPFNNNISLPSSIELNGPWELRFEQNGFAPVLDTLRNLIPLNQSPKEGIKYFSGTVTYHHAFKLPEGHLKNSQRAFLRLEKVREIAEVYLNGRSLGLLWHAPFEVDITEALRPGDNHLIVEVVNTPNNALIGDAKLSTKHPDMKSNINRLPNAWSKPFVEAPLIDAGLIGPVTIQFAELID
jgi:hypothetical protein